MLKNVSVFIFCMFIRVLITLQGGDVRKESSSLPSIGQIDSSTREGNLAFLKSIWSDVDTAMTLVLEAAVNYTERDEGK